MPKTEVKNLPQRHDKKVPAQLNASIDEKVLVKFNAFVAWLNMDKGELVQVSMENLMNEEAYAEFRTGYANGTITAPPAKSKAEPDKPNTGKAKAVSV